MIRSMLNAVTEADLEEASNKLTVRRARIDLDQGLAPTSILEDDDSVVVVWDDATCTFDAGGLLAATCTCPSRGFCRHQVRTALHLNNVNDASPEPTAPPVFDLEELRRAAGAATWRKACELLNRGVEARIEGNDLVTFPSLGIRLRLATGLPIEAALCSCGVVGLCEHRLMAALSLVDEVPEVHKQPMAEIQETCGLLWPRLVEILGLGLDGLPVEVAGNLQALSRQVKNSIPAASRDLRALAGLIEANARRSARFSPRDWLQATARLAARLIALEAIVDAEVAPGPRLHIIGRNRRDYIEAATLRLWSLGAEGSRGPGGSLLRIWFMQLDGMQSNGFLHLDVGRSGPQSPSPEFLWKTPVLWSQSPSELHGEVLKLHQPRLSPDGALAASDKSSPRPQPHASIGLDALEPTCIATNVEVLSGRWREQIPPLLRSPNVSTMPAILACDPGAPLAGPPVFHTHNQTLLVPLQLSEGGVLSLEARYRPDDDRLFQVLSQIERWASAPTHWFVRFRPTSQGLRAAPVAVWLDGVDKPFSLEFSKISLDPGPPLTPIEIHGHTPPTDPVDAVLDQLLGALESSVCQGIGRQSPLLEGRLRDLATDLDRLGLTSGARILEELVAPTDLANATRSLGMLMAWAASLREAWHLQDRDLT